MYKIFEDSLPFARLAKHIFEGKIKHDHTFTFDNRFHMIKMKNEHLGYGPKGAVYLTISYNSWPHFHVEYMFEGKVRPEIMDDILSRGPIDCFPRLYRVEDHIFNPSSVDQVTILYKHNNGEPTEEHVEQILMGGLLFLEKE